mmetsp:Transcript_15097/g.49191  ORF Transcript_15097/g.49191 Transcript_15097/m.49191 type:complete len:249 (+) Transcript_15097:964-1710(+)
MCRRSSSTTWGASITACAGTLQLPSTSPAHFGRMRCFTSARAASRAARRCTFSRATGGASSSTTAGCSCCFRARPRARLPISRLHWSCSIGSLVCGCGLVKRASRRTWGRSRRAAQPMARFGGGRWPSATALWVGRVHASCCCLSRRGRLCRYWLTTRRSRPNSQQRRPLCRNPPSCTASSACAMRSCSALRRSVRPEARHMRPSLPAQRTGRCRCLRSTRCRRTRCSAWRCCSWRGVLSPWTTSSQL